MYIGWIAAKFEDMNELLELGIMVGNYNKNEKKFNKCRCDKEALNRLDVYWNSDKYEWSFREAEKNGDIEFNSKIKELDSGDVLTVTQVWEPGLSDCIDFIGTYGFNVGIDQYGSAVKPSRGFSFKDEDVIWKRVE